MCGRYSLEDPENLDKWFEAIFDEIEEWEANYNVAPTHIMPIIRQAGARRVIEKSRWGLLPFWAREEKISYSMINARSESLATKRSFTPYFKKSRCLVPATGFYEWKGSKGNKTPFYIYPTHEPLFAFAGLQSLWKSPEGKEISTYTIVTTQANNKMKDLHGRMPVMLLREEWDQWLDPGNQDTTALQQLMDPFPDDAIDFYQVSKQVNSVRNNSPDLIREQPSLFD